MVALTADDLTGTSARVRAKKPDGSWGPWYEAETLGRRRTPTSRRGPRGTEPVFVGRTTTVQIAVTRPGRRPHGHRRQPPTAPAKPGLGYMPANVEQPFGAEHQRGADQPAAGAGGHLAAAVRRHGARASRPTSSAARNGAPTRRCDAGTRCTTTGSAPRSSTTPRAATTTRRRTRRRSSGRSTRTTPARWAGATSPTTRWSTSTARYSRAAQAASTKPVEGSHTGGFNRNTWGVAMIGNFDDVPPTPIQLRTIGRLLGWRLGLDHVDPQGHGRTAVGRRLVHQLPGRRHRRRCRRSSPTATSATPTARATPPTRLMDEIRDIAARFNDPPGPEDLADSLRAARSMTDGRRSAG